MIVIKDKGKQSKIYVSRTNASLSNSQINEEINGDVSITESDLYQILEDYVKKNGLKTINGQSVVGEGNIIIESSDMKGYLTVEEFNNIIDEYATTEEVKAVKTWVNQQGFLTEHQSLEGYATEEWVEGKKYLTQHQDISGKQDKINDLDTIRSGAAKGATAIQSVKTINGQSIVGSGNITIEGGSGGGGNANIVELTQSEYDAITPDADTIYVISDAPAVDSSDFATKTELNNKQDTLVSGENIKTINGNSILGSGDIVIEGGNGGGEHPIYYLFKETSSAGGASHLTHNKEIRSKVIANASSEEYPILILKDWYNDTISNNVYVKDNYVEIQCANARVSGNVSDLIDERYELTTDGWLRKIKTEVVASQNWVTTQLGNIETILDSIIGE